MNDLQRLRCDDDSVSVNCDGHVGERGHVDSDTGKCFYKSED